jgi:hypothetical protein
MIRPMRAPGVECKMIDGETDDLDAAIGVENGWKLVGM